MRYYLRRFSRELGREVTEVAPEALERLCNYSWPGNVRELQSVLKQALLQARGTTLLPTFLPALPEEPSAPVTAFRLLRARESIGFRTGDGCFTVGGGRSQPGGVHLPVPDLR